MTNVSPSAIRWSRRATGRSIVIGLLAVSAAVGFLPPGPGVFHPAVADVRPNVIIIITDDQRADQLARMPRTISEMAGKGVKFDQAFASHPLCCPSRASILRGQYAHTTGIYTNGGSLGGWAGFRDRGLEGSTLATWLDDAGYETALVGKYLNGYAASTNHVPPGWDFWRGGEPNYYNVGGARTYQTDLLTRYADEFIRGTSTDTPLFRTCPISSHTLHRSRPPATPPTPAVMGSPRRACRPSTRQTSAISR